MKYINIHIHTNKQLKQLTTKSRPQFGARGGAGALMGGVPDKGTYGQFSKVQSGQMGPDPRMF